jgi:predicted AlkP superfamily pyrophosphatase or phosphodiesterase
VSAKHLVVLAAALFAGGALLAAGRDPHVLLISIDGLMPAAYTQPGPAKIPAIRRLAAEGAYAEGVAGVLPTVTYPAHTTLITGVTPAVHGIVDNRMFDPDGKSGGANYWYARDIRVPTLLGAVHGRGWRTGAVSWPVTVGLDVDFHVPEFWRSNYGADFPESASFLRAASTPHLLDAVEIARGKPLAFKQTDEDRTDIAAFILKTYQPHLLAVHLIDLDSRQHTFGPGSPEALDTLERLDGMIGTLLRTLETSGLYEQTYVAIVSDHGFRPIERQLQPNTLFKQEGLITVNEAGQITAWQAVFHASGGSGFVYLKDPADRALRDRVQMLLQRLKADPANGIESVWTSAEIAGLGGPPDAAFGIDMRAGFYTGGRHTALVTPTRRDDGAGGMRGGHGFSPLHPELRSAFVVNGPTIHGLGALGIVRMTQIAPTLARWLGVGLSPLADGPVDALVTPPPATAAIGARR